MRGYRHAKSERERRKRRAASQDRYEASPRGKYQCHKQNAKRRRVPFELTFAQWLQVWAQSGRFGQPGYVMSRNADRGPYAVGNVEIVPREINTAERNRNYAMAKRAGISWDYYRDGPPESPDSDVPF